MRSSLTGAVSALVAVTAWGASFTATRVGLETLSPVVLVAWRLVIATAILVWLTRRESTGDRPGSWREAAPVIGLGCVFAVHLLIQAWGLEHTTAVHTGWIIGAMPAAIAVGAWLVFGQRLSAVGWLGVALASLGVATVVWAHPPGLASARFGDLLQVVSIGTWTVYTLVAVRPVARWGALAVTTASMALAAVVAVPVALALGRGPWMPGDVRTWSAVLFLGIVAGAVAQALWLRALGVLGAARTAAWLYLEPIVTVAVARALLSEPVGWRAVVGGFVVLIGVAVVQAARNAVPAPAAGQPVSRR